MTDTPVVNIEGAEVERIVLPEEVFAVKVKPGILHACVVNYLANNRKGCANTKSRSEVRGGGKKPWKQKGTGRARAGTIRSPLWKGGSVIFGPNDRKYSYSLTKNTKRLAMKGILSSKLASGSFIVFDSLKLNSAKTKEFSSIISRFSFKSGLLVTGDKVLVRAARNIGNIEIISIDSLNVYEMARADKIFIEKSVLLALADRILKREN